jgi:hypothetical protein
MLYEYVQIPFTSDVCNHPEVELELEVDIPICVQFCTNTFGTKILACEITGNVVNNATANILVNAFIFGLLGYFGILVNTTGTSNTSRKIDALRNNDEVLM